MSKLKPILPARCRRCQPALGLLVCLINAPAWSGETNVLANLSFEQLSQIQVTTAAKRPEPLADTPAAVYVLTGDEIHRLGVTTLPEALRYVPGIDVGMIDASHWAVAARGFNGQFANQLLVMMDGRSIYNPSFGGVFWNAQDYLLEDLDRIEVVRGPGGALWGANAVNGVINIITKPAQDTQGTLVTVGRSFSVSDAETKNNRHKMFSSVRHCAGNPTAWRPEEHR